MPNLGLAFFLASWKLLVSADFTYLSNAYSASSTPAGFLVEYFTVSSVPQQVFADISCSQVCDTANCLDANCRNLCAYCPGLAQYESKYATDSLGSLSSRSWVRVSATVAPAIEFKIPAIENTSIVSKQDVPGDEWYGYYYPRQDNVFQTHPIFQGQRPNWGMRVSGRILLYSAPATRIRVQVLGAFLLQSVHVFFREMLQLYAPLGK